MPGFTFDSGETTIRLRLGDSLFTSVETTGVMGEVSMWIFFGRFNGSSPTPSKYRFRVGRISAGGDDLNKRFETGSLVRFTMGVPL